MKQIEFSRIGTPQDVVCYAEGEWPRSQAGERRSSFSASRTARRNQRRYRRLFDGSLIFAYRGRASIRDACHGSLARNSSQAERR
jgi:hypothetical protein